MRYEVIYDVTTAGYDWWPIGLAAAVALGTCVALLVSQKRFPTTVRGPWHRPVGYTALAFVCYMAADAMWSTHREYMDLSNRLRDGDFDTVEGTVESFSPSWGKAPESFVVDGHRYVAYLSFDLRPGFHATAANRDLIRDGVRVRIADVDGTIARLEILHTDVIAKILLLEGSRARVLRHVETVLAGSLGVGREGAAGWRLTSAPRTLT